MDTLKLLEDYYKAIVNVDKWPVLSVLRELYVNNPKFERLVITEDDNNYENWDMLRTFLICDKFKLEVVFTTDTLNISQRMADIIENYKKNYMNKITLDEYESYVLTKIFLKCFRDENIKRFILFCLNFKHLLNFLKSIDVLYKQKMNVSKLKSLFGPILFDDVFEYTTKTEVRYDIVSVLSSRQINDVPITIKLKRLQPHAKYINNYRVSLTFDTILTKLMSAFKSTTTIISVVEFYDISTKFDDISRNKTLKHIITDNSFINQIINKLNVLYANILILALFKYKEESTTHHTTLYSDLIDLYKQYVRRND
ncbi:hypothetical protein PmNV_082 [Penaeus monodon nudivirus]|uniref:Uncharacterized protein n=1 Tax=Penaeus monodon nudivirus TaxID=1529056 RepID=A0A076FE14_9VIRU|nr:hypothetical protein PmNV_082 [Penaeus monodon nudivirus]AII15870.1 hypothetical protein PmNV_082 [Penaeus monodon nudivirus]